MMDKEDDIYQDLVDERDSWKNRAANAEAINGGIVQEYKKLVSALLNISEIVKHDPTFDEYSRRDEIMKVVFQIGDIADNALGGLK